MNKNLRLMLLKMLNGIPQEHYDEQMKKAGKANSLLQRTLFSYESDNLAKYEEIERHGQMLQIQSQEIKQLKDQVTKLEEIIQEQENRKKSSKELVKTIFKDVKVVDLNKGVK